MAEIKPFRAYRYLASRVAPQDVLTQPYDKITLAMQARYYASSPYNLVTVEKGCVLPGDTAGHNVYTRAASKIKQWIAEQILVEDEAPGIYLYSQEFLVPELQTRRVRTGFIALLRIEDYDKQVVFRHEYTLSGPKADRIELLRKTCVQTGQLFLLYDDPARQIDAWVAEKAAQRPLVAFEDEFGVTHHLWPISDARFIERIREAMTDKKIVIADGHHRYETALAYRDEWRARTGKIDPLAASEFAMATFINAHSRGLTILATHRLVSRLADFNFETLRQRLAPFFDWYSYPFASPNERATAYDEFRRDFEKLNGSRRAIGVYPAPPVPDAGAFYLFVLKRAIDVDDLLPGFSPGQRGLDVVLLHRVILEKGLGITAEAVKTEKNVSYEREMEAAIAAVERGDAQIAFLLNPVRVQQVMDIALAGDVLPQKSTDFYPKLLSGLAIYRVEGRIND